MSKILSLSICPSKISGHNFVYDGLFIRLAPYFLTESDMKAYQYLHGFMERCESVLNRTGIRIEMKYVLVVFNEARVYRIKKNTTFASHLF